MSPEQPPHRVLLVREWDVQMSGSGCCGRLGADAIASLTERTERTELTGRDERTRTEMEQVGAVYRALRERFSEDDVELTIVDPRNAIWLVPAIWRDARERGLSAREALRQANAATAACALVCDGLVLTTDATADPARVVAAVEADLATPRPGRGTQRPA